MFGGKFPRDPGIPPFKHKNLTESSPLKWIGRIPKKRDPYRGILSGPSMLVRMENLLPLIGPPRDQSPLARFLFG